MPARGKGAHYQGAKWIRPATRFAIYVRAAHPHARARALRASSEKERLAQLQAALRCVWCGRRGVRLCLDHLTPWVHGGSNHPTNLITACFSCNTRRGARDWTTDPTGCARLRLRVERLRHVPLPRELGRALYAAQPRKPWRYPRMCGDRIDQDERIRVALDPTYRDSITERILADPDFVTEPLEPVEVPF